MTRCQCMKTFVNGAPPPSTCGYLRECAGKHRGRAGGRAHVCVCERGRDGGREEEDDVTLSLARARSLNDFALNFLSLNLPAPTLSLTHTHAHYSVSLRSRCDGQRHPTMLEILIRPSLSGPIILLPLVPYVRFWRGKSRAWRVKDTGHAWHVGKSQDPGGGQSAAPGDRERRQRPSSRAKNEIGATNWRELELASNHCREGALAEMQHAR